MRAHPVQLGHAIDDVSREMKPVKVIHYGHVKWSRGGALFLVPADVQIIVTGAAISEPVNQPGITVIGEDDRFLGAEHRIKIWI